MEMTAVLTEQDGYPDKLSPRTVLLVLSEGEGCVRMCHSVGAFLFKVWRENCA